MNLEKLDRESFIMLLRFAQATSEFERSLKDFPKEKDALKHELTFLFRNGSALSLFGFLEKHSKSLCHEIHEIHKGNKSKVNLNQLNGNLIDRLKTYFRQFLDSEIEFEIYDCWKLLDGFATVRHCLVHNNGCLEGFDDKNGKLKKLIKETPTVDLTEDNYIVLEEDYLKEMVEVVRRFFDGIYSSFDRKV